eukprot:jgi/Botrbrau1/10347/Bobra.0321s0022.1
MGWAAAEAGFSGFFPNHRKKCMFLCQGTGQDTITEEDVGAYPRRYPGQTPCRKFSGPYAAGLYSNLQVGMHLHAPPHPSDLTTSQSPPPPQKSMANMGV